MTDGASDLPTAILKTAAVPGGDAKLGRGEHYLFQHLEREYPEFRSTSKGERAAAVWSLLERGLAYIGFFSQEAQDNWTLRLTDAGRAAARDEDYNPDNDEPYMRRLRTDVPAASATVLQYAGEAVRTYREQCYLASAVMLGVASEAAFLEMTPSFGAWLQGTERQNFMALLNNDRTIYLQKFDAFRKRIEPKKGMLPPRLGDGLDLTFNAVLEAFRVYRNQAGHPTGKQIDRGTARIHLEMFPRYLQKLYGLKAFFDGTGMI